jgi:hypothetical protein
MVKLVREETKILKETNSKSTESSFKSGFPKILASKG